jgi:adenosine deaminase
MEEFVTNLEKGELHVHLNGLVSTDVVRKLLLKEKDRIPEAFDLNYDLNRLVPAPNLITYLKPWQVLRLIPRNRRALGLIVDSAFKNLKTQNISFVELRNSIIYIALLNNITVDKALHWLIVEVEQASYKYNIRAGLILTVSRGDDAVDLLDTLLNAYSKLGKPSIVVGLDLAGNEDMISPPEICHLFIKAKIEYGLRTTIHAGETGNENNILDAVINFQADRIGHGTAASKSEAIMNILKEKDVCIEVCPISNRLTGAIGQDEPHPVLQFIAKDVPFVICSDNPSIHCSGLNDDYLEFYRESKSQIYLKNMLANQKKYSFIQELK